MRAHEKRGQCFLKQNKFPVSKKLQIVPDLGDRIPLHYLSGSKVANQYLLEKFCTLMSENKNAVRIKSQALLEGG